MEALLHSTNKRGSSLLHAAARGGNIEFAKVLIDEYSGDTTARDNVSVCVISQGVLQCALGPVVCCVLCDESACM